MRAWTNLRPRLALAIGAPLQPILVAGNPRWEELQELHVVIGGPRVEVLVSGSRPHGELQSSLKTLIAAGSRPSIPTVDLPGSFGHNSRVEDTMMGPLPEVCRRVEGGPAAPFRKLPPEDRVDEAVEEENGEESESEEGEEEAASPSRLWKRGIRCRVWGH